MAINSDFKDSSLLKVGDILLCLDSKSFISKKISNVTGSKYSHAAIYYGNSLVAESVAKNGLKKGKIGKTNISDLISRYDHIAVLRQPDAWIHIDRIKALQLFIDTSINTGAKYNFSGIPFFAKRKKEHILSISEKLEAYFNNKLSPTSEKKTQYFCSEFVSDCFIAVGFIDTSASILYQSDTYSPGDLGKDPTFGTFWGYLTGNFNYKVPETDYFYNHSTVDEIFST